MLVLPLTFPDISICVTCPYTRAFRYSPSSTTVALNGSPTWESALVSVSSKRIRSAVSSGTANLGFDASAADVAIMISPSTRPMPRESFETSERLSPCITVTSPLFEKRRLNLIAASRRFPVAMLQLAPEPVREIFGARPPELAPECPHQSARESLLYMAIAQLRESPAARDACAQPRESDHDSSCQ